MSRTPHFGHTKTGLAVHARTIDHHKGGFNKFIAVLLTARVGNMRCFWYFCALALLSLPATLHEAGVVGAHWLHIPSFFLTFGFIFLDAWVCQNFIQLVLLPALMVGQNLQNEASDARSAKQFEDTETIADRLDLRTQGGLADVMRRLDQVGDQVNEVHRHVTALAPQAGKFPPADEVVAPPAAVAKVRGAVAKAKVPVLDLPPKEPRGGGM